MQDKKINFNEVVNQVFVEAKKFSADITEKDIKLIIICLTNVIKKNVKNSIRVSIMDFGIFWKSSIKSRMGVNPQNFERIKIRARKVPRFTASKNFDIGK